MFKDNEKKSNFYEEIDFNLDPQCQKQSNDNCVDWLLLIPNLQSISEETSISLTSRLKELCEILANPYLFDNINSNINS